MNADWLIGVTVFLPLVALVLPLHFFVWALAIGLICGIAWTIAIRDEL